MDLSLRVIVSDVSERLWFRSVVDEVRLQWVSQHQVDVPVPGGLHDVVFPVPSCESPRV